MATSNEEPTLFDYRMHNVAEIPALFAVAEATGSERELTYLGKLQSAVENSDGLKDKQHIYVILRNGQFMHAYSRHWINHPPARVDDGSVEWLEEAAQQHVEAAYIQEEKEITDRAAQLVDSFLAPIVFKQAAETADLTDDQLVAAGAAGYFDAWQTGHAYPANKRLVHNGIIYVVQQDVVAQAHQPPDAAGMLALYRPVHVSGGDTQDGSLENPFDLLVGMAGVVGLYYRYDGVLWQCLREMGNILETWLPGMAGMETFWRQVEVEPKTQTMALSSPVPVAEADIPTAEPMRYFLNSGKTTYHRVECPDCGTGSFRTLEYIAENNPNAKACAVCQPPAMKYMN